MIRHLYKIKEGIKSIYIWNVNYDSMWLFAELLFSDIQIVGFVVPSKKYEGEYIFKRPVLSIGSICDDNYTIVCSDRCVSIGEVPLPKHASLYKFSELFDGAFSYYLENKEIHLYGAGVEGKSLYQKMKEQKLMPVNFLVSENHVGSYEIPIVRYCRDDYGKKDAIVVAVSRTDFRDDILETMDGLKCDVYIDRIFYGMNDVVQALFSELLAKAIREDKKIFFCGNCESPCAGTLELALSRYGIELSGYYGAKKYQDKTVFDIYDLTLEDPDKSIVVVDQPDGNKRWKILQDLSALGYDVEHRNVTGFQFYTASREYMMKINYFVPDALVDSSMYYGETSLVGWQLLKSNREDTSLIILGGSTSTDGFYQTKSWGRLLFEKLKENGISSTVYIGARGAMDSVSEALMLIRDGHIIKPNIVISMSGLNNMMGVNRFNIKELSDRLRVFEPEKIGMGISTNESSFEFWLRTERLMKIYSESLGAKFYCFLQPFNCWMDDMSFEEKMQFEYEDRYNDSREFAESAVDEEFVVDLSGIFHHEKGTYFDACHYSEKGNTILAQRVYDVITEGIKNG